MTYTNDRKQAYRDFKNTVVSPTDTGVTESVEDQNLIPLQTRALTNYSRRPIVQAKGDA
jgi:hypothetical protein